MVKPCLTFLGLLHKHCLRKTTTKHCLGTKACLDQVFRRCLTHLVHCVLGISTLNLSRTSSQAVFFFSSVRLSYPFSSIIRYSLTSSTKNNLSVSEKLSKREAFEAAIVTKFWQLQTFRIGIRDKVHVFTGIHTFRRFSWHTDQWLDIHLAAKSVTKHCLCNVFRDAF